MDPRSSPHEGQALTSEGQPDFCLWRWFTAPACCPQTGRVRGRAPPCICTCGSTTRSREPNGLEQHFCVTSREPRVRSPRAQRGGVLPSGPPQAVRGVGRGWGLRSGSAGEEPACPSTRSLAAPSSSLAVGRRLPLARSHVAPAGGPFWRWPLASSEPARGRAQLDPYSPVPHEHGCRGPSALLGPAGEKSGAGPAHTQGRTGALGLPVCAPRSGLAQAFCPHPCRHTPRPVLVRTRPSGRTPLTCTQGAGELALLPLLCDPWLAASRGSLLPHPSVAVGLDLGLRCRRCVPLPQAAGCPPQIPSVG